MSAKARHLGDPHTEHRWVMHKRQICNSGRTRDCPKPGPACCSKASTMRVFLPLEYTLCSDFGDSITDASGSHGAQGRKADSCKTRSNLGHWSPVHAAACSASDDFVLMS